VGSIFSLTRRRRPHVEYSVDTVGDHVFIHLKAMSIIRNSNPSARSTAISLLQLRVQEEERRDNDPLGHHS
jgi:hypothetical protein